MVWGRSHVTVAIAGDQLVEVDLVLRIGEQGPGFAPFGRTRDVPERRKTRSRIRIDHLVARRAPRIARLARTQPASQGRGNRGPGLIEVVLFGGIGVEVVQL